MLIPNEIRVGNICINHLSPLGGFHKPATTKAGRLSLMGYLESGQKVKIFGAYNSRQVQLRTNIDQGQGISGLHFPSILAFDDNLIVEEWIEGVSLKQVKDDVLVNAKNNVREFLIACSGDGNLVTLSGEHKHSFCYIDDYLLVRLRPWAQWLPVESLLDQWGQARLNLNNGLEAKISHPDLSLANMVVQEKTGKLFVIDNELLGVGLGWLLDGKNSFLHDHPLSSTWDEKTVNFVNLTWRLRKVGSAIDAGDFNSAANIAMGGQV